MSIVASRIWRVFCLFGFVYALSLPAVQGLAAQSAQISNLRGTFWLDLDLNLVVAPSGQDSRQGQQSYIDDLIFQSESFVRNEASYVFYGMIYGFQVIYRPPDRFHQQPETFLVRPQQPEIIRPDDLEIYHITQVGERFYYSIRKAVSPFESLNIQAWRQADKTTLQASGAVPFAAASNNAEAIEEQHLEPKLMIQLKKAAIDNAIKAALRKYFRKELRSKPAQIRVNLALSIVPDVIIGRGELWAKVRLHMGSYQIENYETR